MGTQVPSPDQRQEGHNHSPIFVIKGLLDIMVTGATYVELVPCAPDPINGVNAKLRSFTYTDSQKQCGIGDFDMRLRIPVIL
ncbi:hypothetical protein LB505_005346, partial [Fusarium chuoi]